MPFKTKNKRGCPTGTPKNASFFGEPLLPTPKKSVYPKQMEVDVKSASYFFAKTVSEKNNKVEILTNFFIL